MSIEARESEKWRIASSKLRNTCSFEGIISLGLGVYTVRHGCGADIACMLRRAAKGRERSFELGNLGKCDCYCYPIRIRTRKMDDED